MEDTFWFLIPLLAILLLCGFLYFSTRPNACIVEKYGKPLKYFSCLKAEDGIPSQHTRICMYFYPNFIIVEDYGKEYLFDKSYRNFKFVNKFPFKAFEVHLDSGITCQLSISSEHEYYLKKFFGVK